MTVTQSIGVRSKAKKVKADNDDDELGEDGLLDVSVFLFLFCLCVLHYAVFCCYFTNEGG
jgi:hypothetical protein